MASIQVAHIISLLHVRGGVSEGSAVEVLASTSSPRPWRCFLNSISKEATCLVFSTSVEVFLGRLEKRP